MKTMRFIHGNPFFLKKFQHIIERLENRRTPPALHTGRQLAVKTGKKPSTDRRQKEVKQRV